MNGKLTFSVATFFRGTENVGQTIYVAGPPFLRMVLAVILAVTVYSKPGKMQTKNETTMKWQNCMREPGWWGEGVIPCT